MRQDTFSRVDLGINREVTFGLAWRDGRFKLMLTRFFTTSELEQRRLAAQRDGRTDTLTAPYSHMSIPLEGGEIIRERKEELQILVTRLCAGDDLEEDECMVRLSRSTATSNRLFIKLDSDTSTVHVRKFWRDMYSHEWKANKAGVTISPQEFARLLMHIDDMMRVAHAQTLARCGSQ